jgi:glycosyltransferase involved in cell wall biosynthesis
MRISAALSRFPQPASAAPVEPAAPTVRVLIFYDEEGWAWWHRARQIRRNVTSAVRVEMAKVGAEFNHHDYDLIVLFDAPLLDVMRHIPREKVIAGSSCPRMIGELSLRLEQEQCRAGLVNSLQMHLEASGHGLVFCCQNGVDVELFHPAARPVETVTGCWVGNSKSIGNKGLDLIRSACAAAGVRLLVWDKADPASPILSQEQIRDSIYHRSSFYICASEFEGTPNPMLEAMACGLPVVSTRVGNAPELILEGVNGFLCDRSVEALAQAIRKLKAADPVGLARNARDSILSGWTWKQQAAKYEQMFLLLAEKNRRHPGNPKTRYKHVLWLDAHPPSAPWDPAPVLSALREKYPGARLSVCCESRAETAYAAFPGLANLVPFDRDRAQRDGSYFETVRLMLRAIDADFVIEGSSSPSLVAAKLAAVSTRGERVAGAGGIEALEEPIRKLLTPYITRLVPTSHAGYGTAAQPAALLSGLGIDVRERSAPPADFPPIRADLPKVLLVAHSYPPHWYAGVEVYTSHLAHSLRKLGVDVSVFHPMHAVNLKAPEVHRAYHDGIPVHVAASSTDSGYILSTHNPGMERVFSAVLDEGFEVVHFQHTMSLSFSLLEIAGRKGLRTCMTLHDLWMMCSRVHLYIEPEHKICAGPDSPLKCARCCSHGVWEGRPADQKLELERLATSRMAYAKERLRGLDALVSPTRYLAGKFEAYGFAPPGKIEISQLGLRNVARLQAAARPAGSALRFAFMGSIHPLKNVYMLAEAFRAVRGNATLSIYGNGRPDHLDHLMRTIAPDGRVGYFGGYAPSDLPRLMAAADVVVMCSITENYPLVAREALSAGVPVLGSRVGGIPEIIQEGINGLLFDPSDRDGLTALLQSLTDRPERAAALRTGIRPVKTLEEDAQEWLARYRGAPKRAEGNMQATSLPRPA